MVDRCGDEHQSGLRQNRTAKARHPQGQGESEHCVTGRAKLALPKDPVRTQINGCKLTPWRRVARNSQRRQERAVFGLEWRFRSYILLWGCCDFAPYVCEVRLRIPANKAGIICDVAGIDDYDLALLVNLRHPT